MLRPSKIFVSFHQLRHFFQTKISELVVTKYPQKVATHFPISQQTVHFFSDVQRSLLQGNYLHPAKYDAVNEKVLLKVIRQHFPAFKVFSSPALNQRMWATSSVGQQQFRTMMSASSGAVPSTTFAAWGFPRTTGLGAGRTPAFARQFSTTKTPCVNLFQNTTNPIANGQPSIFTHLSSRIFSPAGTKMNQSDLNEKQPNRHTAFHSSSLYANEQDNDVDSCNRIFTTQISKGMDELVNHPEENTAEPNRVSGLLVRRESISISSRRREEDDDIDGEQLESIIRHDDLYSLHNNGVKNRSSSNKRNAYSRHVRLKQPPDHHHVKQANDQAAAATVRKSSESSTNVSTSSSIYLLITLDNLQFLNSNNDWTTQSLSTPFIDSIESMAYEYQIHINYVLKLLDTLQRHGKFRIVARQHELRIYFPAPPKTKEDAIQYLRSLNMVDPIYEKQKYFSIVVEDHHFLLPPEDFHEAMSEKHAGLDLASTIVGPDYFKDLQLFLDRTDHLIETSPGFASCHHL
ncbi:MAG: hypothetical protein EXX96DRAFT_571819 [Benjaminiella poitrasii]|nr:MAG: hypothetical protein EXX96DRAFT_571819 [Benjaminiella poitrasii]